MMTLANKYGCKPDGILYAHHKMKKKYKLWFIIPTRNSTLSRYYEKHMCSLDGKRKKNKIKING
jgi:hypothetical protein